MININKNYESLNNNEFGRKLKKASYVSFRGHSIKEDTAGKKEHYFYLPMPANHSNFRDIKLEIVALKIDANGNFTVNKDVKITSQPLESKGGLKLWKATADSKVPQIGYRFIVYGKEYIDTTQSVKDGGNNYAVAASIERPNLTSPHQIYHLMPDNFNPANNAGAVRTHFNKFDGTINGITQKLDYLKNMGVARILSTPIVGNDQISSHGYWTTNPMQVTSTLGNINDYKKLNLELYKRGMGLINDGAFVNEGWEGIHLRDVMKHGEKSPFFHWFETHNFKDGRLKLGILPEKREAYDNFEIALINSPVTLDTHGKPGKTAYDVARPTFIQLYDKRLAGKDYKGGIIRSYPIKQLKDRETIRSNDDAIQPVLLEVKPEEVEKKLKNWKPDSGSFRDSLLEWENFKLVQSGEAGGITLWDGNNDIPKLIYMVSEKKRRELNKTNAGKIELAKMDKAISQVQDYMAQVGGHWTNEIDKTLTEYTSKTLHDELKGTNYSDKPIKKKAELIFNAIKESSKNKALPEKIQQLIESKELTPEHIKNLLEGNYQLKSAPLPESILDGLMSCPLTAIEFPREISSILSSPYISKLASKPEQIGQSRLEFKKSPDYKEADKIYKSMDEVYEKKMAPLVKSIIEKDGELSKKMLKDGELSTEGREIFRLISGDITKYIVIKALANVSPTEDSLKNGQSLDYDNKNIALETYKHTAVKRSSPEAAAESVVSAIETGIKKNITDQDKKNLTLYLEKRVEGLNPDLVKVSKLLLDKTESGLEWRIDASKDVADMFGVKTGDLSFKEAWNNAIGFWSKFNKEVRKYNDKAYTIGEVTDVNILLKQPDKRFSSQADATEKFIRQAGFVTSTNYDFLFSLLPRLVHGGAEKDYHNCDHSGVVDSLQKALTEQGGTGFLKGGTIDAINYSHVSPGNHDKPRILHALALNMGEFFGYGSDFALPGYPKTAQVVSDYKKLLQQVKTELNKTGLFNTIDQAFSKDGDWWKNMSEDAKIIKILDNFGMDDNWMVKHDAIKAHFGTNLDDFEKYKKNYDLAKTGRELGSLNSRIKGFVETNISAVVMAKALNESIEKALANKTPALAAADKTKLMDAFKGAIDDLATGTVNGSLDKKFPWHFARRPFDQNWKYIAAAAAEKLSDSNLKSIITSKEMENAAYKEFITPALEKYKSMIKIMVCLPGNPTVFGGDELGMDGFETPSKNVSVNNRNLLPWKWLTSANDDGKGFIRDFNSEIAQILSLRNNKNLTPLVNGHNIFLKAQKTKENDSVAAIYRYNTDRDVITLFNNAGLDNTRATSKVQPRTLDKIDLSYQAEGNTHFGLPTKLQQGQIYLAVDDNKKIEYMVKGDSIVRKDGKPITISDSALILYRKEPFKKLNQNV